MDVMLGEIWAGSKGDTPPRAFRGSEIAWMGEPEPFASLPILGHDGVIYVDQTSIISSSPKVGKTTLLFHAVHEWLHADYAVFYITEENIGLWRRRLAGALGDFSPAELERFAVFPAFGVNSATILTAAAKGTEWFGDRRHKVVVIDTLPPSILQLEDENDNSEIARVLTPWITAFP